MHVDQPTNERVLLSTVEDVFEISGRGCAVVPGQPAGTDVSIGETVWLERPDGSELEVQVAGKDLGFGRSKPPEFYPWLLGDVGVAEHQLVKECSPRSSFVLH